jgi:hypothetical protein
LIFRCKGSSQCTKKNTQYAINKKAHQEAVKIHISINIVVTPIILSMITVNTQNSNKGDTIRRDSDPWTRPTR